MHRHIKRRVPDVERWRDWTGDHTTWLFAHISSQDLRQARPRLFQNKGGGDDISDQNVPAACGAGYAHIRHEHRVRVCSRDLPPGTCRLGREAAIPVSRGHHCPRRQRCCSAHLGIPAVALLALDSQRGRPLLRLQLPLGARTGRALWTVPEVPRVREEPRVGEDLTTALWRVCAPAR